MVTPAKKMKVQATAVDGEGVKNLFVGNLSWNVDEEWLAREFEEFGELAGARVISDKNTGRSKGYVSSLMRCYRKTETDMVCTDLVMLSS